MSNRGKHDLCRNDLPAAVEAILLVLLCIIMPPMAIVLLINRRRQLKIYIDQNGKTFVHEAGCPCDICGAAKARVAPGRLELAEEIRVAFNGVPLDDGVSLHQAEAIARGESRKRIAWVRQFDNASRWQDTTEGSIVYFSTFLSCLDAKGLRFYLPAFMIWALKFAGTIGYSAEGGGAVISAEQAAIHLLCTTSAGDARFGLLSLSAEFHKCV